MMRSIGSVMKGSELEEVLEIVHGANAVSHAYDFRKIFV